ncbi:MAG: hypothetical protein GXN92_00630 [Candidatus Micrarchaeota archaeon]|nr:hypothetical protein [Candidatus Micrarchaeota archaeon]
MFSFDHLSMLGILFFLYGIPALVITLLMFKELNPIERFLLGFFASFIGFGVLHSIIGYILGEVSYLSILLSWLLWLAIIVFVSERKFHLPSTISKEELAPILGLVVVLVFTYMIRMSSFTPIYLEFDPYFYLEGAKILLKEGIIPMHDDSAWYPYIEKSSHRTPPLLHYTIATWYYLYPHETVDRYLLSAIANYYPPLAAVGFAFMFYLLGYALTKNRWIGVGLAVFAAYTPVFIYKLMSGVFEVQPFNFFIFSFVSASLALYLTYHSKEYLYLLTLAVFATILGAVASPAIIVYLAIALTLYAWKEEKSLWLPALATILGGIWLWIYMGTTAKLKYGLLMLVPAVLPYFKKWLKEQGKKAYPLIALGLLIALAAGYFFFGSIIRSALVAAQYNNPLERTIQEQTLAGSSLALVGILGTPADQLLNSSNMLVQVLGMVYALLSLPGHFLNLVISLFIDLLQLLGLNTTWIPKEASAAYGLFALAIALLFWDLKRGKWDGPLLIAIGALTLLIGLIKAKFSIYFVYGFLLVLAYLVARLYERFKHPEVWAIALVAVAGFGFLSNLSLSLASFVPTYGNDPHELQIFFTHLCSMDPYFCNIEDVPITLQYHPELCAFHLAEKYGGVENLDYGEQIRIQIACNYMPAVWVDAMEWLYNSTPNNSRIISWWDYGHWINYWGERKAVIRNEHSVLEMILDTAYAFVMGNETTLEEVMERYDAQYALIDQEIVIGSNEIFGGKFFALNYLACAAANQTSVKYEPMESRCEWENLWEVVILSSQPCEINGIRQGYVAMRRTVEGETGNITPTYEPAYCFTPNDGSLNISRLVNPFARALASQRPIDYVSYTLEGPIQTLHKALWIGIDGGYVALYLKDPIWFENGKWVGGYEDRTTRFYDSVLYKAFVLEDLQGFTQTYNNGYVKIYLRENTGQG